MVFAIKLYVSLCTYLSVIEHVQFSAMLSGTDV